MVIALLLAAGCAAETMSTTPYTVVDSAGWTIVTNREGRWHGGREWAIGSEPDVVIGVVQGGEEYEFHDIADAAAQSDGDIVIADAAAGTVRMYSAAGTYRRTLGRAGSAPGEFRRPSQVLIDPTDAISVWDSGTWWLTRFSADGDLAGVEVIGPSRMAGLAEPPLYPDSAIPLIDGTLLVRLNEKAAGKGTAGKGGAAVNDAGPAVPGSGSFRLRAATLRASFDSSITRMVDTFAGIEQVSVESPWGELQVTPALAKNTSIATQPNALRICGGDREVPEIRCVEDGGVRTLIRWRSDPVPVEADDPDVAEWRETMIAAYGQKLSPDATRRFIDEIPVPAVRPPYSTILLDRTGHLWVGVGPARQPGTGASEFLVFTSDGVLLGRIVVPRARILEIGEDYLIGVYEDELGVQFIERYRLDRAPR